MQIADKYSPQEIESKWYDYWIEKRLFHSEPDQREPYTIVIPPPNVTGMLHMGHMLNNTLQDVLVRRARMSGKNACWVPGMDHASIATEAKVVAMLHEKGIEKSSLSREKFLEYAWEWKEKYGGMILKQLRKLGASCDWERTCFTMDEPRTESVIKVFCDLFEKGRIYRGVRMVNWDPAAKTALSDEEVVFKESHGKLYYLRYKIEGTDKAIIVATTRPETILGDTALCVNPNDPRYASLPADARVIVPLVNRSIPVIRDEYVDIEFGTGALKVTPAHDVNDYMLGEKYGLETIDIFNDDGTINDKVGMYVGMDRFDVRKQIEKDLAAAGLLEKTEEYTNNVGYSERTGVAIEPKLSMQWFLSMEELARPATKAVMEDAIRFVPEKYKNTYRHWMENIKDWCISRQLWWGQRIPAYYLPKGGYVVAPTAEEALAKARAKTGDDSLQPSDLRQDEDVLDTWFSSWLWPISVFDGIRNPDNQEISYYYPTNDLVTGPDIIFFWVARMIMAGYEYRGEKPFGNVYFTGIIRDMKGRKMSKSLGNSPDPLDIIARYGADGLRFGVMNCAPQGQDILFSEERVELGRNFCNKLWNACRFRQMSGGAADNSSIEAIAARIDTSKLDANDHAILANLRKCSENVARDYESYQFNSITQELYAFFWNDFCGWYLEVSKARMADESAKATALAIQDLCLRQTLLLLHPFMPFITEELWHSMGFGRDGEFIQNQSPEYADRLESLGVCADEGAAADVEKLKDFATKSRALKAQVKQASRKDSKLRAVCDSGDSKRLLLENSENLKKLIGASEISIVDSFDGPAQITELGTVYIDAGASAADGEDLKRLEKELEKLRAAEKSAEARLSNEAFISKAPPKVIEGAKRQLEDCRAKIAEISRLMGR